MKGALVFLAIFILVLLVTFAYPDVPPGRQVYNALNLPTPDYLVGGVVQVTTLVISVFNGVIYGVVVWLIYTLAARARKPKPGTPPQS